MSSALPHRAASDIDRRTVWLIIAQSSLWSAGAGLTTGWFLTYFAQDLGATGRMLGLIAAMPELVGVARVAAPRLIDGLGSRKRTFVFTSFVAYLSTAGVPLAALPAWEMAGLSRLWMLVACLFVASVAGFVAYVAYLSWVSDLIPQERWGRFFGLRNVWFVGVRMVALLVGGGLQQGWVRAYPERAIWIYVVVFLFGTLLFFISLVPLWWLRDLPVQHREGQRQRLGELLAVLGDGRFRRMIAFGAWLALWSGMTQAAFPLYSRRVLAVELLVITSALTVMRLCQMAVSPLVGVLSDRFGNKPVLVLGVLIVGAGPLFWLLAGPAAWWMIFGAYVAWGAWAAVNICGQNLMLKLSPQSNNAAHIAVYQGLTGLCAGVSGILGGYAFDWLEAKGIRWSLGGLVLSHYHLLFIISWLGRTSAVLFVFPIYEPGSRSVRHMMRVLARVPSLRPRRLAGRALGAMLGLVTLRQARGGE